MVQLRNHDVENGIEREVVQTALFIAFSGLLIGFLDQQQREPNWQEYWSFKNMKSTSFTLLIVKIMKTSLLFTIQKGTLFKFWVLVIL